MALQTITSIAICKFIPCGADSTMIAAKPGSRSRKNLSEKAAVIEEAIDGGKENGARSGPTTNSTKLTESSEVSVSAGLSTRNERMADEDENPMGTQPKEKQEQEKSVEGNGNSALPGARRALQSSVLATGAKETTEDAESAAARKPIQATNVPEELSEAPIDKQETAPSPEPDRSPSPEFIPEDWWIEMACDYWEMDEKEVLKIVFRATDRDVTFDKADYQEVSEGGSFQPIKPTPAYHCGTTEPVSPDVCDQMNRLSNDECKDRTHDLTTRPYRRIGGRRVKLKIAKFGRLPTIEEEPLPSNVPAPGESVVEGTTTVRESTAQASGESKHQNAEPFESPVTMDNSSLPAPENTRMKTVKSKTIKKRTRMSQKQAKHSDQTPGDTCLFNEGSAPNLTRLGVENTESSHRIGDDERRLPRLRSTLRRKNNLVAARDLQLTDNAVGGPRKQWPTDFEATSSCDMNSTNNGEVKPFQFETGVMKIREHNPSQNWESQSTSTKIGGSLPTGTIPGRLVEPACQPHPPSLPAPGKRNNPRARRFVKPLARGQPSLMDKKLVHRVRQDDLRLPNLNSSGEGRAMSHLKQHGVLVLPRMVQNMPPSLTKPKPPSGNSAKQTIFDHQKPRPNPRQKAREPKLHLPPL